MRNLNTALLLTVGKWSLDSQNKHKEINKIEFWESTGNKTFTFVVTSYINNITECTDYVTVEVN